MFHKWLGAARARRHKRILLRERHAEFDRASMQVAWDRWREKYMEEKLHPIVSSQHSHLSNGRLRADFCIQGPPGSATEPKEPPFPRVRDLALKDKSE